MICFLWDLIQLFKSKPVNVYNSLKVPIERAKRDDPLSANWDRSLN
jgi:hypothetical protein